MQGTGLLLLLLAAVSEGFAATFSLSIEAAKLPTDAEFVPVVCRIEFAKILKPLNVPGVVDERSLRLFETGADGKRTEVPYQFSVLAQVRPPSRPLLEDTPKSVSYAAEYRASELPAGANVRSGVRRPKAVPARVLCQSSEATNEIKSSC